MLTDFQKFKIDYLFELLDLDSNGQLDLEDFSDLAENVRAKLNHPVGKEEHREIAMHSVKFFHTLLRDVESQDFQSIKPHEWSKFFEKIISDPDEQDLDEYVKLFLNFIFGLFDGNQDGFISIQEYIDIFEQLGINKDYSEMAFNKLDTNADKRISRYELIAAIETFLTSPKKEDRGNWIFGNWEVDLQKQKKPKISK